MKNIKKISKLFEILIITILLLNVYKTTSMASSVTEDNETGETIGVTYRTHVQDYGWQGYVQNGEMSGTSGQLLRLEGINIKLINSDENLNIKYQTYIQNTGWQSWKYNGEMSGTTGQCLRVEAIRICLEDSEDYSIMYRVHVQDVGWQSWVTDGEIAGTTGQSLRLEAIEIKIVKKEQKGSICIDTPSNGTTYYTGDSTTLNVKGWKMANVSNSFIKAYIDGTEIDSSEITYYNRADVTSSILNYGTATQNPNAGFKFGLNMEELGDGSHTLKIELYSSEGNLLTTLSSKFTIDSDLHVSYRSHVQDVGWQSYVADGTTSGTTGESLRIEALNINLENAPSNAKIKYRTHVQDVGWQGWVSNGETAGTTGESLRVEAIEIKLENMDDYTIEYRVHIQDVGWTDWYIDGETAGTIGQCKRIEAIQIRIVDNYKRSYQGIDISHHNGEVNYSSLISSGEAEFVIARAGWYSESQSKFIVDTQFERNYTQAHSYNIPLGTYIYSYATSVAEAKTEAKALVAYLESSGCTDFDLPIYYDVEDSSQTGLGKDTIAKIINSFCDIVSAAGYETGVYTNEDFITNYINVSEISSNYSLWYARWGKNTGSLPSDIYMYSGTYDIWQYTSNGTISGISGYVDKDISYKKFD